MKSQIKKKRKYRSGELPMPTLNKLISYQFLFILLEGADHEQSSQNNQSTWVSTTMGGGRVVFQRKLVMAGQTFLYKIFIGEVSSKWQD